MKKLGFLFLMCLPAMVATSQGSMDTIMVAPGKQGLYFYHVVEKGETLFALSRQYGVTPEAIATVNHLTVKSPLKLYQLVKVPLNTSNLDQTSGRESGLQPLFHKVVHGETLFRIGEMHDKVSADLLKQWNQLQGNALHTGQYLIVGWLKTGRSSQNLASAKAPESASPPLQKESESAPLPTESIAAGPSSAASSSTEDTTAIVTPAPSNASTTPSVVADNGGAFLQEVIAAERAKKGGGESIAPSPVQSASAGVAPPQRQAAVIAATPTPTEVQSTPVSLEKVQPDETRTKPPTAPMTIQPAPRDTVNSQASIPLKQGVSIAAASVTPPEKQKDTVAKENPFEAMLNKATHRPTANRHSTGSQPKPTVAVASPSPDTAAADVVQPDTPMAINPLTDSVQLAPAAASEFESLFMKQTHQGEQVEAKKGAAGWFRSNVAPGSGRYYALCDALPRGTIIQVINPINGKQIYAKVLDSIPKLKENYNLVLKVSDAAMQDLGTNQPRFWTEIKFAKQ